MKQGEQATLVAEDLRVWVSGRELLAIPKFELAGGSIGVILGPRDAGKTLFLLALAGLIDVLTQLSSSGTVRLGSELLKEGREQGPWPKLVAYVPAAAEPFPGSVVENLAYVVRAHLLDRAGEGEAMVRAALEGSGMLGPLQASWHRPAAHLAPWELRLLAMARALVLEPAVLLLDAPETGLEEREVALFADLVRRQRGKRTVVWATRRPRIAARVGDVVSILKAGRLLESGSPTKIFLNPEQPETEQYLREALW